jgi:hypothetical protein
MTTQVGDRLVIESNKVGSSRKSGEIIEVMHSSGGDHFRVRWDDGHESIVYPSSDASITSPGDRP